MARGSSLCTGFLRISVQYADFLSAAMVTSLGPLMKTTFSMTFDALTTAFSGLSCVEHEKPDEPANLLSLPEVSSCTCSHHMLCRRRPPSPRSDDPSLLTTLRALLCLVTVAMLAPMSKRCQEIVLITAQQVLAAGDLPAAVRMAGQTSKGLRTMLQPVLAEAITRRLQWLPEQTMRHAISNDGKTLTKVLANGHECSRSAGPLLPTTGRSAWKVRVDVGECSEQNASGAQRVKNNMFIGVCDAHGRNEWGLDLCEGVCYHLRRNHKGQIIAPADRVAQILSENSERADIGSSTGCVVEVLVDHDGGTLSFRVDGGPPVKAQDGFERGAPLRPYASLGLARAEKPDRVSFLDAYRADWPREAILTPPSSPTAQAVESPA